MVAGHGGLMNMDMNINACVRYGHEHMVAWIHGCMGLDSYGILIHMQGCNGLGWHNSKLMS